MKKVLVTGANKGIGKAICELLLTKYPDVYVLLGSRDVSRGKEAVKELTKVVPGCDGRLEVVQIDTSSEESVKNAAESVGAKGGKLYGIINNAGIGFSHTTKDQVNVNYFGPRRVNLAFKSILQRPGGRIVNVSSASGPNFVASLEDNDMASKLSKPLSFGTIDEVDNMAKENTSTISNGYGFSKALLNAYTALHAAEEPDLVINSCTPGYIATDLTAGMGATNPPSKGAIPPVHLMMSADFEKLPSGRYYGSDCVRSPIHFYRGPGEPPYEGE